MGKRFALISGLVAVLATPLVWAESPPQTHPFETLRGLERFNKSSTLAMHDVTQTPDALLEIKGIKIGDNVLQQAINLEEQGGQLGRIRGGSRSDKIKFSFYQPYEDSRLEQKVELYFDKYNGFIKQVTASYFLQDAYLSIVPIREQSLSVAIDKFGTPMTMQQVYDFSGQKNGEVKFERFIKRLQSNDQIHPLALEYFQKRNISRSSKWVKGEQDYALMHSGFDRCYLWHTNTFQQILTFCFFDKTSANPNTRGIELDLHDFPTSQQITELGNPHDKPKILL